MAGILLMGFVQGESRQQAAPFPACIEELVPAEHLVRVIDAWVGTLEMVTCVVQCDQNGS